MRYLLALLLVFVAAPARADAPALNLTPSPVDFGTVVVGATSTRTVQALNESAAPVTVTAVVASGVTVQSTTCSAGLLLAIGERCEVVVQWQPTVPGLLTGSLSIQTDTGTADVAMNGQAVAKLSLTVKAHGKSLRVRKPATLISTIGSNGQVTSSKVWCTYLGKKLPAKFAKRACGLKTSGSGAALTARARPLCTEDVTLEGRVTAKLDGQAATWKRTWRVFVQPHAEFHPSEPICAVMGERFG